MIDISFKTSIENKKIIIFSHGFKGFKDWGCFNLISKIFAENDFVFLKFNFSHNGTTVSDPLNFVDLDAFGNNNFTKELTDLGFILEWVENSSRFSSDVTLIGHSRGGSISILRTSQDNRVKRVVSWASPSNLLNRISEENILCWKENGVIYVYNGRTKQNMPLYIQFHEDSINNKTSLDIKQVICNLSIPQLIVHGSSDPTVDIKEAKLMHEWNKNSKLLVIKDSDHVFGAYHPFDDDKLPSDLQKVVDETIKFINLE